MLKKIIAFIFFAFCCLFFFSCKKETVELSFPNLSDYCPLQTGRVLIYRLDSIVTPAFGTSLDKHSALAKDSIADSFLDNNNRLSYRVYRFTTDTLAVQPWQYRITYYITPTNDAVELVDDNNLRFIKLKQPLRNDFSWKGNAYIDTKSASSPYQYMDEWDYTYENVNGPYTVLKGTLENTVTVFQRDETSPDVPFDPMFYQQRNYSVEVYAKGIGLIYKEFLHWTWQTDPPPAKYQDDSYGITLNLIDVK